MLLLFHRPEFIICLAVVLAVHWSLPGRFRNLLLLAASYGFYASWDWRFLACLWFSTFVDFACGWGIDNSNDPKRRKYLLIASVLANLGMLGFFKYVGFFTESLVALADTFEIAVDIPTLNVIIPLGISFYTFQTMSYTIDIYRGKLKPTKSIANFALFVAYFPQLIAGPIEKARDLLPQIESERDVKNVNWREGAFLFAQGWALKVILADPAGNLVNEVFASKSLDTLTVMLGLYAVAIQLYGDFAGYSRMARGISAFLGIRLSVNFNQPFFATGYVDFYKRWHITLSSWIGEYVYRPLYYWLPRTSLIRRISSTRVRLWLSAVLALFVTRMIFAIWHGADATFISLGLFIFVAQMLSIRLRSFSKSPKGAVGHPSRFLRGFQIVATIHLFTAAMLFYRAESMEQVWSFCTAVISGFGASHALIFTHLPYLGAVVGIFALHEIAQYVRRDPFWMMRQSFSVNTFYYVTLYFLYRQSSGIGHEQFIYFQF